jgi:hypothetical protein
VKSLALKRLQIFKHSSKHIFSNLRKPLLAEMTAIFSSLSTRQAKKQVLLQIFVSFLLGGLFLGTAFPNDKSGSKRAPQWSLFDTS